MLRANGGETEGEFVNESYAAAMAPRSAPTTDACSARIVDGSVDAHIVFRDDDVVAFLDRSPLFPGHTLVVPRRARRDARRPPASDVGPFWRRVQHISRAAPGPARRRRHVRGQQQRRQPERRPPPRARRAAARGDGLRGLLLAADDVREGEAEAVAGGSAPVSEASPNREAMTPQGPAGVVVANAICSMLERDARGRSHGHISSAIPPARGLARASRRLATTPNDDTPIRKRTQWQPRQN